jgi:hypothetical protein
VEVLEDLLAQARTGRITGFAFACRLGPRDHGIGITGEYRQDSVQALAVNARINHVINHLIDARSARDVET